MRKYLPAIIAAVIIGSAAVAGSIKVWASGDVLTASDINGNFEHIHSTMVGGHGARLVNADISGSAAISHTKLATPALLPKAWAYIPVCTSGTCTIGDSTKVTSVVHSGTGIYDVTLAYSPTDTLYAVIPQGEFNGGVLMRHCQVAYRPLPDAGISYHFEVACMEDDGSFVDSGFSFLVMDN